MTATPTRSATGVLAALCVVMLGYVIGAARPSLPPHMKADEPAYYLMAMSLAFDGDLRCEPHDLQRMYSGFMARPENLILMSDDLWHTIYFGKPYVYSLLAAPLARLFDASGLIALNVLLLFAMIAMGMRYLIGQGNSPGLSLLFSCGFFLLSCTSSYVFWMHPELFNMACIMASMYLVFTRPRDAGMARVVGSGAAIALAVYSKPMFAAMGLPIFVLLLRRRRVLPVVAWFGGIFLAAAVASSVCWVFTGHPSQYLGVERMGINIDNPTIPAITPVEAAETTYFAPVEAPKEDGVVVEPTALEKFLERIQNRLGVRGGWGWLVRVPDMEDAHFWENSGYFLIGRHTGLFAYMPFALLSVLLFLVNGWRSPERWATIVAMAVLSIYFLIWIPFNWHGGGGFIGNRYIINVYPALLFLVTRIRPVASVPLFYFAGSALVGALLFTGYGPVIPYPTLQAHARNRPLAWLPRELSHVTPTIPGYRGYGRSGVWFEGRKDLFREDGDEFWILGGTPVDVLYWSYDPLPSVRFQVRSLASNNRVELLLGHDRERLDFGEHESIYGAVQQVDLQPDEPWRIRMERGKPVYYYRLTVMAERGERPQWRGSHRSDFYIGAAVSFLGPTAVLERDIYHLEWTCDVRGVAVARPGQELDFDVCVTNRSQHEWPSEGVSRVAMSYHIRDAKGELVEREGKRARLADDTPPGAQAEVRVRVIAPTEPGEYEIEFDPIYEYVAWFSDQNEGGSRKVPLRVVE